MRLDLPDPFGPDRPRIRHAVRPRPLHDRVEAGDLVRLGRDDELAGHRVRDPVGVGERERVAAPLGAEPRLQAAGRVRVRRVDDPAVPTGLVGRELGLLLEDDQPKVRATLEEAVRGREAHDPTADDDDVRALRAHAPIVRAWIDVGVDALARRPGRGYDVPRSPSHRERRVTDQVAAASAEPGRRPSGRLIAAVATGTILNPLNSSMIAVALVPIAAAFGAGTSTSTWLISGLLPRGRDRDAAHGAVRRPLRAEADVHHAGSSSSASPGLVGAFAPTFADPRPLPGRDGVRDLHGLSVRPRDLPGPRPQRRRPRGRARDPRHRLVRHGGRRAGDRRDPRRGASSGRRSSCSTSRSSSSASSSRSAGSRRTRRRRSPCT